MITRWFHVKTVYIYSHTPSHLDVRYTTRVHTNTAKTRLKI